MSAAAVLELELPAVGEGAEVAPPARCRLCGRVLRNPTSVAAEVGPTCFAKAAAVYATASGRKVRVWEPQLALEL